MTNGDAILEIFQNNTVHDCFQFCGIMIADVLIFDSLIPVILVTMKRSASKIEPYLKY